MRHSKLWNGIAVCALGLGLEMMVTTQAMASAPTSRFQFINGYHPIVIPIVLPTFPITMQPDGIDIYPDSASDDGDNHYIHASLVGNKYIFSYCRNGVDPRLAAKGAHPVSRDCYRPIGNPNGYTLQEIKSVTGTEIESEKWSGYTADFSSVLTAVGVFAVVTIAEAVTLGDDTPAVPLEVSAMDPPLARAIAKPLLKQLTSIRFKLEGVDTPWGFFKHAWRKAGVAAAATATMTGSTSALGSKITQVATHVATPSQIDADLVTALTAPNCHYITDDSIQLFEQQVNTVLGKIQ
ncbi:MAG: hypothetical protein P4M08_14990 [Oligoflexia bacterium]|nr:hypothetical protein [Oligoflexia bacterium]